MKRKRRIGLAATIFIGLILGAVTGALLYYVVPAGPVRDSMVTDDTFYVVGSGFLRPIQILAAPLVFCSLVCDNIAMGDTKKLGRIEVKTLGFYLVTATLAITTAILTASVIGPDKGLDMTSIETADVAIGKCVDPADTLLAVIPTNPLRALVGGGMLSIILLALFVDVTLADLGESGETMGNSFSQFNNVMMQVTAMVMKLTPYGVFCPTARTFPGIGFDAFALLLKCMVGAMTALATQCLVVYIVILRAFTGLSPGKSLRKSLPVMGLVFSTATSDATIPMSIDTLHRKMEVAKWVFSFTTPLGATINMDGTVIIQGVAMVFASQTFGIYLAMADYFAVILITTLASIGTVGVPGVGLIILSMVFASMGLPVEVTALTMGVNRILDTNRTAANTTGGVVYTTIVASQDGVVDREAFDDPKAGAGMEE